MAGVSTVVAALRLIPLFEGLSDDRLEALASHTLVQTYPRGHILFTRGDPGDRAYVILSGAVDLVIESIDGHELILARLGPGEHFGEMALMDDLNRSASARTAEHTEVVVVLRGAFFEALERDPGVSRQIIRSLVRRLRLADEKIEAFAYLDVEGRIARTLVGLERGPHATLRLTHEELARMSATSRQTTTRVLNEWAEAGYVSLSRGGIVVANHGALQLLAEL